MRSTEQGRAGGFTLVELLVVMAIISILGGLTLVGIQMARKSAVEQVVATEIKTLAGRLENFKAAFGDYPPTSLADLKVKGNAINEGNESLFAFLLSRKHGGPFADDLKEDRWRNADADEVSAPDMKTIEKELQWVRGNSKLLEYTDYWGNPYVYIHWRDYGKKLKYQGEDAGVIEATAQKSPETGSYYAPTTYQIWSFGPDGENQNGDGDDIVSWR
jgi:prepilin-type N-terminal cleavage/methylation domain-containing protein